MKITKLIAILGTMMIMDAIAPEMNVQAADVASGVVDEDYGQISWKIDENGRLTVTGTGDVIDPTDTKWNHWINIPWYNYKSSIVSADINVQEMTDMSEWFYDCSNLESVNFGNSDTSTVTNMEMLFHGCGSLKNVDLDNFNTSNVTDMNGMFDECGSLSSVDLSGFDTSEVTDMGYMFDNCSLLESLDVSSFDTSKVTDMWYMFQGCSSLTGLDVSNFDTRNVDNMSSMFEECRLLENLDVSHFNTSKVNFMNDMFENCSSLVELDVSRFDTGKVVEMSAMFSGCSTLKSLDVSGFNTSNVQEITNMFEGCSSLEKLDVSNFDTSRVGILSNKGFMYSMFEGCSSLKSIDVSNFDTSKVKSMSSMFKGCSSLENLDVSNFDTRTVGGMSEMFEGCSSIKSLDVSNFDTSAVVNMQTMFKGCSSLENLDVSNFNTSQVWSMAEMFSGCSALTELDVSNFNTSNVKYMEKMFYDCSALRSLDLSSFDTSNILDEMSNMFYGCEKLVSLDVSSFNTSNMTDMEHMFAYCESLESLDLRNFDTSNVCDMSSMFYQCNSLKELDVSSFDTSNTTYMWFMFEGCSSLESLDVSNFDTSNVTEMMQMFNCCSSLQDLDLSGFDTSNVKSMSYMFEGCSSLKSLDISNFDTSNVTNIAYMFTDCNSLEYLNIDTFDISSTKHCEYMFSGCSSLEYLDISNFDTSHVPSIEYMFADCSGLTGDLIIPQTMSQIGAGSFIRCSGFTGNLIIPEGVYYIGDYAFKGCSGITSVTIPQNINYIGRDVFGDCNNIERVYYAGTMEEWNELNLGIDDEVVVYCSDGDNSADDSTQGELLDVKYFYKWDPDTQTAYWSDSFLDFGSMVVEETDKSFIDNIDKLLNSYVLVYTEPREDGKLAADYLISINPVETKFGIWNDCTDATVTLDGIKYEKHERMFSPTFIENGAKVLYFISEGKVVGIHVLDKQIGTLKFWNEQESILTINPYGTSPTNTYKLSPYADKNALEFLQNVGNQYGYVKYIADGQFVYYIEETDIPEDPDNYYMPYEPTEIYENKQEELMAYYAYNWVEKYDQYISAIRECLEKYSGTAAAERDNIIEAEAKRMREVDGNSNSKYINFVNFPESYKYYAYKGLAEFMYDYACSNIDFSNVNFSSTSAAVSLVKSIMKSMEGTTASYSYGDIEVKLNILQLGSSKFGTLTCSNKTKPNKNYEAVICSTQAECYDTIEAYWEELQELEKGALYNIYTAVSKDILGQPITAYTEKYLKQKIGKFESQLKSAGVGKLAADLNECHNYYSYVNKIINGNLTSFEGLLEGMGKFQFKDSTITDKIVKKAMSELQDAKSILYDAGMRYVAGTLDDGNVEKWWRIKFGCPINIAVYDSEGHQIGYAGKDDIWYTEAICIKENGDAKIVDCYTDDNLSFEIIADDYGTLGCSIEEYGESGKATGRLNFYDIPLSPNQELRMDLPEDLQTSEETLAITTGNDLIYADEYIASNEDACVSVICTLEENAGIIYGEGEYVRGDVVNLLAVPNEKYTFAGWYKDDVLVCVSESYEFTVKEDVQITPKFQKVEYLDVYATSEEGGSVVGNSKYYSGDIATVFAFPDTDYNFLGWYINDELVSTDAEYQFVVIETVALNARFVECNYNAEEKLVERIYGKTRYETSFKIADAYKEKAGVNKFNTVVIACGTNFADALAGSYLASVNHAPILMYNNKPGKSNVVDIVAYVNANLASGGKVYLLGGISAVGTDVESALSAYNVKRLGGNTRYDTNLAILAEAGVGNADILVCTGQNFADSLSGSAVQKPILLVNNKKGVLTDAQKAFLRSLSGNKLYVVGGNSAVSSELEAQLRAYGNVERIGGATRYETSVLLAEKFFDTPKAAVLALGKNFPDGLCGGMLAISMDAPLVLTISNQNSATADAYAEKYGIESGAVLGGPELITDDIVHSIFNMQAGDTIIVKE